PHQSLPQKLRRRTHQPDPLPPQRHRPTQLRRSAGSNDQGGGEAECREGESRRSGKVGRCAGGMRPTSLWLTGLWLYLTPWFWRSALLETPELECLNCLLSNLIAARES